MSRTQAAILVFAVLVFVASEVKAANLVYTPLSPTFGGNAFAAAHLMSVASVSRPKTKRVPKTFGDELEAVLERYALRGLTSQFQNLFDFPEGESSHRIVETPDLTIEIWADGEGGFVIETTDKVTGAVQRISTSDIMGDVEGLIGESASAAPRLSPVSAAPSLALGWAEQRAAITGKTRRIGGQELQESKVHLQRLGISAYQTQQLRQ